MNQHAVGSLSLAAVAGECIAVIQVRMVFEVEFQRSPRISADGKLSVRLNLLDLSQFTIGDTQVFRGGRKLNPVALCKIAFRFTVDRDGAQAARVVIDLLTI